MKIVMRTALALAALCIAGAATAQTAEEAKVFDQVVRAFAKSGRAHIYQCRGPSGGYDSQDHHPEALARIARAMAAGDERRIAAGSGCRLYNDGPTEFLYGTKLIGQAARTADAVWLIGEVTESYPQATGYTFEAIVRIPMTPHPAASVPAVGTTASAVTPDARRADAEYFALYNTRSLAGTTEDGGWLSCPDAGAIDKALDAGASAPLPRRDERMEAALRAAGCRTGTRLLTGIRVRRHVPSEGTEWYAATAVVGGRPVHAVLWLH